MASVRPSEIADELLKDGTVIRQWLMLADRLELSPAAIEQLKKHEETTLLMYSILDYYITEKGQKNVSEIIGHLNDLDFINVKEALERKYGNQVIIISKTATRSKSDEIKNAPGVVAAEQANFFSTKTINQDNLDEVDFVYNMEPLTISVKKSAKCIEGDDRTKVYPSVQSSPRGYALIINNTEFKDRTQNRKGGALDGEYMKKLLEQLKYECKYMLNVESDELDGVISSFKKRIIKGTTIDSCIVVVMSHGGRDEILMSDDEPVNMWNDIVYKFDNNKFPELKGIPKIFITQACQNFRSRTGSDAVGFGDPSISDTIVCFPSIPGQVARRDEHLGSWFIYCLTKVFMENAHNMHLEDMLRKIQGEVMTRIKSEENVAQVSTWQPFLFKHFYFNPTN